MEKNRVPEKIEGNKTKLRSIGWESMVKDARSIVKWTGDPEIREALKFFSFFQRKVTLGQQLEYFSRMIGSQSDQIFVIETKSGEFLGTCGLHDIDQVNNNLRIGIIIFNKDYWRQGYGRQVLNLLLQFAFENLEMNKVYLTARVDNQLAIHIYTRLGFKEEGILREEYWVKEDQYIDLLRMSILRDEWVTKGER